MQLNLVIDLGSSLIKVLYSNETNLQPDYIAIEPEIIEVPASYLDPFRPSVGNPVDRAFIELGGRYYAVGKLARKEFHSTTNLALLKSDYAVQRILSAVWVASQKYAVGKKFRLLLTCLLPPGELREEDLLRSKLNDALLGFNTPSGRLQVKLSYFSCYPEGGGLSMFYQKHHPGCRERVLGVVMLGHRNLSTHIVDDGICGEFRSSDLGFMSIVKSIQASTSGYTAGDLSKFVSQYLLSQINGHFNPNPDPRHLRSLLLKREEAERKQELARVIEAISVAKQKYWMSISQWLDTQLANVNDVVVGGGTCRMFSREFQQYIWNLPRIMGKPEPRSYLNAGLVYPESSLVPQELRDRYADALCLWYADLMPVIKEYQSRKKTARGAS